MKPVEYVRQFRLVATVSWVGSLIFFLFLAWIKVIAFSELLPFFALLLGLIPIILFMMNNKVICDKCKGRMKISSGFPRIIFTCSKCGNEVDTGIYSDF